MGGFVNDGLDAIFAAPVFSACFRFHEPQAGNGVIDGCNVNPCVDSSYSVSLYSGSTWLATVQMATPVDQATFFGVWSSVAFDRLAVRETLGTDDNELYGEFFTGTLAPVPEPGTAALWLAGLGLAGVAARRRG